MRKLTIKRTKSFVASLVSLKVYIEDATSDELVINGVSCRKIGTLKNGEEGVFQIGEEATRVYVIADKLSKNYCNEFYEIPAGIDDIHLSGKNKFNLANGNAFRFDGNTSEAVLQNRKKSNRKGAIIITLVAVIGFVIGFLLTSGAFASEPEEKVFIDEGLYIVLDDSFTKTNAEDFTLFYVSDDSAVIALREDFEATPQLKGLSLDEYAQLVIDVNNLTDSEVKTTDDGLVYYEYDSLISETNEKYKYYSFVYKSTDCFWLVQFSSLFENSESQKEQIFEWARTVKFAE